MAAASAPLAADRKYADLLAANDELAAPVNAFFDAVMVMDKDEKVKNNRLALLNQVKKQVNQVADLSQLVMNKRTLRSALRTEEKRYSRCWRKIKRL